MIILFKMSLYKNQFRLDIRLEGQSPMKIDVIDTVSAGLDPRCDLVLTGRKIKAKQMEFLKKEENLALIYLGHTNQTFLNSLPLEEGKTYLLEAGDRIQLSGLEIIVRLEAIHVGETEKVKRIIFNSAEDLVPEEDKESLIFRPNPTGSMKREPKVREPFLQGIEAAQWLNLMLVKAYSLLADFFFTYFILIVLIPMIHIHQPVLSVLNSIPSFFKLIDPTLKVHSFLPFLMAWYLLSLAQTLLFGTTMGQFLLGLKIKSENKFGKLFLYRIKTFIYSLVLIPAQNAVNDKFFFKAIRKIGMIIFFIFILLSPFLLTAPYNPSVTMSLDSQNSLKELKTRSLYSESSVLGVKLNAELSLRYFLLPFIDPTDKSLRGFQLFDLKNSQNIVLKEERTISFHDIEEQLKYANPFYTSLRTRHLDQLSLKEKKEFIQKVFNTSPLNLKNSLMSFGPFLGSSVLLKTFLTTEESSDLTINFYRPETPAMVINANNGSYFYLFTRDSIKVFSTVALGNKALLPIFEEQVFAKFLSEDAETAILNKQNVSILAAQDAFLQGDEQTFLTYYVGIANTLPIVSTNSQDIEFTDKAKLALIKNIESTLKVVTNRNVIQSLNDIKNQLTPMEKPGEKR